MKLTWLNRRWFVALLILGPWLWFFGRALSGQVTFAFRDAAHYYYPLFQWAQDEWSAGRVPLWNSQENLGVPALAETAASVFYPPKLIFALPLEYPVQYNLYVALHILLAAGTARWLARRLGADPAGAMLCGLSYAFGGSVLFQHCNVIFLVGAAWLPLALGTGERMLRTRRWKWSLAWACVLALLVLGGDPQAAYHAGLLAVCHALLLWRRGRRRRQRSRSDRRPAFAPPTAGLTHVGRRLIRQRPVLLTGGTVWAFALASLQILPAAAWTDQSERAAYDVPRNLFEAATVAVSGGGLIGQGLFGTPAAGTHHEHVFDFSVGPWRLAELPWPNFSGRLLPTHRRWLNVIPAEGRVWSPSLYIGLLPLVLALVTWNPWSRKLTIRWMSIAALWFGLGSLGWYGPGWLAREVQSAATSRSTPRAAASTESDPNEAASRGMVSPGIGPQVGGVYWGMTVLLPGYVMFRYPAKLFVVASLGLSVLAGLGWKRCLRSGSGLARRVSIPLIGLFTASGLGMVAWLACWREWPDWMRQVPADSLFGPLDASGAQFDLLAAFAQTWVLSALLWCWLKVPLAGQPPIRALGLLLLTAVDLCVAHHWLVPTASTQLWTQAVGIETGSRLFRVTPFPWRPADWKTAGDSRRLAENVTWERSILFPKYHLLSGAALVEAYGTLQSADLAACLRVARRHGTRDANQVRQPHPSLRRALGGEYLLLPRGSRLSDTVPIGSFGPSAQITLWRDPRSLPRAWLVRRVERLPPLVDRSRRGLDQRTEEVFFPAGVARNWREVAVVESASELPPWLSGTGMPRGSCRIVVDQPQRLEVQTDSDQPALLVVSDLFTTDWQAELHRPGELPRTVPVWRTNRVMRGVLVPGGPCRVIFSYRPRLFYLGAMLSAASWIAVLALGLSKVVGILRRPKNVRSGLKAAII
ncbi:MAG: hypothetical protein J5I93_28310 [Pirellulaceae bacterium]|nr:hypothetical protein [Pirellulaceae bacterium]